jgi:uncharacterized protein (TIGR00251 family)
MRLAVRLTPKGGRDAANGWGRDADGRAYLKVRVSAPPVDGAANAALIAFLAKTLRRPRSSLKIVSGETARLKLVEIAQLADEDLAAAFGLPP